VTDLSHPRRRAFTDDRKLAFWANLSDGRTGVFVATQGAPVPIPRAAMVLLAAMLALGGALLLRYQSFRLYVPATDRYQS
jgi:hypothetical protein